jgi:hypothetical protein
MIRPIRCSILLLIFFVLVPLSLANCSFIKTDQNEQRTYLASPVTPPTPLRTPWVYLTPTFIPTILPNQEQRMINLLHLKNCELPCYLGIIPGKTSWEDAQKILNTVGAKYVGEGSENGFPIYGYSINIGDLTTIYITPDTNTGSGDLEISQHINFTIGENTVQRIYASIETIKFVSKFREYWSRYLLDGILQRIGKPNKIFLGISQQGDGYSIFFIYEDISTVLYFNAIKTGRLVCPLSQDKMLPSLQMTVTNRIILPDLYTPGKVPPTNLNVYLPIEEALGVDETEFYNQIRLEPQTCFEIKKTLH